MIEDILAYNKRFVAEKGYEKYITNKYPDKKIAILSCMDTRLTALRPASLGIKNGDVKMICLLYIYDAADERSSVDPGGRCIIK